MIVEIPFSNISDKGTLKSYVLSDTGVFKVVSPEQFYFRFSCN
jgi:hypothetical protein